MSDRDIDIDITKGLTICLVFLGHAIQYSSGENFINNPYWVFIYSFHMPLFALLSGLFFSHSKTNTFTQYVKIKSIRLLLPCFTWVTVTSFLYTIYTIIKNPHDLYIIKNYWSFLTYLDTFWFLTSLFLCHIYTFTIFKITSNNIIRIILLFIFLLLPIRGHTIFIYPFFIIGILITHYQELFNKYRNIITIICITGFIISYLFWKGEYTCYFTPAKYISLKNLHPYWNNIFIGLERTLVGTFGSISVILLIKLITTKNSETKYNFILKLGSKTLGLYIIQHYTLELLISSLNFNFSTSISLLFSFLLIIIEIPIALFLITTIEKHRLSSFLLLGK